MAERKKLLAKAASGSRLNFRQQMFVEAYINNGGKAGPAYLSVYGGDLKSAETHGPRLVRSGQILEAIERRREQVAVALSFSRQGWLRTLVGMATCTPEMKDRYKAGEITAEDLGDMIYGLDCKASDRKAALDELRDALGFGDDSCSDVHENTARRVLRLFRERGTA